MGKIACVAGGMALTIPPATQAMGQTTRYTEQAHAKSSKLKFISLSFCIFHPCSHVSCHHFGLSRNAALRNTAQRRLRKRQPYTLHHY